MSAKPKRPEAEAEATESESSEPAAAADDSVEAALAELQAKADENWDLYLRAAAEVDNVRKRAVRDVENAHKFALENFSRELLAVVDSLESGLSTAESADVEAMRQGSQATCNLLKGTLERFNIVELDPEGEPFDPEFHEAMSMMPSAKVEPGSVLTVVQKGYALNGRLLRPARVIVAAEPPETGVGE